METMINNVKIVGDSCCGCEACSQICPKKAIVMNEDDCGFMYPTIDNSLCINCGICRNHCPVLNSKNYYNENALNMSFSAYSRNDNNLLLSSSGGVGFEIMQWAFSHNYRVFGVRYSADYKSTYFSEAFEKSDLISFRGTKYIQAQKKNVFVSVKKYLSDGEKVLFIGLPCEVAGLREFVGALSHNLVCVELICHGPTSKRVSDEYVTKIQAKKKTKIKKFTIRKKIYGWTPGCLFASFENGKTFTKLFDSTEYGFAFRNLSRKSCYDCMFKGKNHPGDILIGDYWGASAKQEMWNKNGMSVVFINSKKGLSLLECIDSLVKFEIPFENAISNNSSIFKSRNVDARNKYVKNFVGHNIFYARKKTEKLKNRIIRLLRNVYYLFKKKNKIDENQL